MAHVSVSPPTSTVQITKPSVQLLSPSGRRWLGYRVVHQNTSPLDPLVLEVLDFSWILHLQLRMPLGHEAEVRS